MKDTLVKNTLIIILCNLLIKILALFNRVLLTRLLGNEGISLYMIAVPSVMLFISIGGLSLNVALSKIVSENQVTKKYSEKSIVKKAVKIGMISSILTMLLLLVILKPLTFHWLKQPKTFYPILSTIFFIPFVTLNNIIRGYFNGINKVKISAYANVIEQVARIAISTLLLFLFLPYGMTMAVTVSILAMGFGELISLLYALFYYKKYKNNESTSNRHPQKEILNIAIPNTASRLIGNLTYFLEPIIFTLALGLIGFSSNEIMLKYSISTAYTIPLITTFSFVSFSIGTSIMPNISKAYAANNKKEINYLVKKSLILSFIPGILVTYLLIVFAKPYMYFFYKTDIGVNYVTYFGIFFLLFYVQAPLVSILQAMGKTKILFSISTFMSILKLILIFALSFIPSITYHSLMLSVVIGAVLTTLLYYFYAKNEVGFKFKLPEILNILIISILVIITGKIVNIFIDHYLIASAIISICFFGYYKMLKVTSFCHE